METTVDNTLIKEEFYRSTEKFHVIACWVGLLLNLVWFVSDYFVQPAYFLQFFLFRVAVSGITAVSVIFRQKIGINIYTCMFIVVLGISIQNSYMWSVMDVDHFQQHTFAYMVLFIGAGMLVLWEMRFSVTLLIATVVSNIIFYLVNSRLSLEQFLINGGLLTLTVLVFCIFLIRTRYRLTFSEIRNRMYLERSKTLIEQKHAELVLQKIEIQSQKDTLQRKNAEITDSINYARSIQRATIPAPSRFNELFEDAFVFFKPKDIVSGDFYWVLEKDDKIFWATADCTGHGVPGGFMTMLGLSFLDEIIAGRGVSNPAEVLNLLRDKIVHALNQTGAFGESKDGMDINLCCLDKKANTLTYAAANNDLYIVRKSSGECELLEFKANRQPCGYSDNGVAFSSHTIDLIPGDSVYTFTDGYADQFGGPKGKKFRYKQLEEYLVEICGLPFSEQKIKLQEKLADWQDDLEQVDDVLVIGVKI